MTEADWQACDNPDPMIQALAADHYQRELRLFAVGCVRRVWPLLPDACRAAVEASEQFATGLITELALATAVTAAEPVAAAAFPGHAAPDARGYAASAGVDAASVWPRTCWPRPRVRPRRPDARPLRETSRVMMKYSRRFGGRNWQSKLNSFGR